MTCPARRASQFVSILASFKLHDVGEMMQARSKRQVEWEQISIEKKFMANGKERRLVGGWAVNACKLTSLPTSQLLLYRFSDSRP